MALQARARTRAVASAEEEALDVAVPSVVLYVRRKVCFDDMQGERPNFAEVQIGYELRTHHNLTHKAKNKVKETL